MYLNSAGMRPLRGRKWKYLHESFPSPILILVQIPFTSNIDGKLSAIIQNPRIDQCKSLYAIWSELSVSILAEREMWFEVTQKYSYNSSDLESTTLLWGSWNNLWFHHNFGKILNRCYLIYKAMCQKFLRYLISQVRINCRSRNFNQPPIVDVSKLDLIKSFTIMIVD